MEFFDTGRIYKAFQSTLITLIPKSEDARHVKYYRPIVGCTNYFKILSKIMNARLGKVLQRVISPCQAVFVPGQNIHNHILLAYEIFKGYDRKGGTPRYMMQMDHEKDYGMVDWGAMECIFEGNGYPQAIHHMDHDCSHYCFLQV